MAIVFRIANEIAISPADDLVIKRKPETYQTLTVVCLNLITVVVRHTQAYLALFDPKTIKRIGLGCISDVDG